jgi:hypothetical protein
MASKPTKNNARRVPTRGKGAKTSKAGQPPAEKVSKQDQVLALLRRQDGASIEEIIAATYWQPNSVRGFLSGAVKKRLGIGVVSEKGADGVRRYHVAALKS